MIFNQLKAIHKNLILSVLIIEGYEDKNFYFVPFITVEVERLFSKYKNILSKKRKCLDSKSIKKYEFLF